MQARVQVQVIMEENGNVSNKMLDLNINSGLLIYSIYAIARQFTTRQLTKK